MNWFSRSFWPMFWKKLQVIVKFILFVCLKLSGFIIYNLISRHSAMKLKRSNRWRLMCELIINDKFWGLVIIWTVFCRKQESKKWKEHHTNIIKPNVFQEKLNIYFKILVYFWFWNRAKWILHQIEFIYLFYIHVIAIWGTFFFFKSHRYARFFLYYVRNNVWVNYSISGYSSTPN